MPIVSDMMVIPGAADKKSHLPIKPELGIIHGLLIIPPAPLEKKGENPGFLCRVDGAAPRYTELRSKGYLL